MEWNHMDIVLQLHATEPGPPLQAPSSSPFFRPTLRTFYSNKH